MNSVYRLWSDWDIGEYSVVFETKAAGKRWLEQNEDVKTMAAENNETVRDCIEDCFAFGYFSWEVLTVMK